MSSVFKIMLCQTCCEAGTESHGSPRDRQVAILKDFDIHQNIHFPSFSHVRLGL